MSKPITEMTHIASNTQATTIKHSIFGSAATNIFNYIIFFFDLLKSNVNSKSIKFNYLWLNTIVVFASLKSFQTRLQALSALSLACLDSSALLVAVSISLFFNNLI